MLKQIVKAVIEDPFKSPTSALPDSGATEILFLRMDFSLLFSLGHFCSSPAPSFLHWPNRGFITAKPAVPSTMQASGTHHRIQTFVTETYMSLVKRLL